MNNETSYGIRAVLEAIKANKSLEKIFLQKGLKGDLYSELEKIKEKNLSFSYVLLKNLTGLL